MSAIDFRTDQIQTSKIIVTGSNPQKTLLIYGIAADGSPSNQGNINQAVFPSNVLVRPDVFLFVSGAANARGSSVPSIAVFGGDVGVLGAFYQGPVSPSKGGDFSHSQGFFTFAVGNYSHAEGAATFAVGNNSHAEGGGTFAVGEYSHAEGTGTVAFAANSHAEGIYTLANNIGVHTEGYFTTGSAPGSHAEGTYTITTTDAFFSHVEGALTTGSGVACHAEGYKTFASGNYSHTEGKETVALGEASHAEGYQTIAFGTGSHAGGWGTIASGSVNGSSLGASSVVQTVFGRFNERGNTTSNFVIGNGTGDSDTDRRDMFRVESTKELVLSGGIRHHAVYTDVDKVVLTKENYIVIANTKTKNVQVFLPEITDPIKDIGLTLIIRRDDVDSTIYSMTIELPGNNSGYEISGFDTTYTSYTMTSSRQSLMLTFMGSIAGTQTWFIVQNSNN